MVSHWVQEVAVQLNLKYNFLCTVLEAPFTSIADVANYRYKIYPTKYLVKDKFDNLSKIDKIKSPLLIVSGKNDEVVPHIHSKLLLEKAINLKNHFLLTKQCTIIYMTSGLKKQLLNLF